MIKFINKATGIIEEPHNEEVIKQYQKSKLYRQLFEKTEELPKNYDNYTLKELKQEADKLGLSYKKRATKSDLIALLNN